MTAEELWADFPASDKRTPLDTEVLKTWEEDGVVLSVVRYTVGVLKGHTVKMAGYYAYPKNGTRLPAIVQINGGGQKAGTYGPIKWARYGYACFNPNNGCQPWDGDLRGLPNTDWGSLKPGLPGDKRNGKGMLAPGPGTIDDVASPRNHQWYPRMVGARRAISFLQSRPEVDPDRIGGCGFWWDDYPCVIGNQRGDGGADEAQKRLFLNAASCDAQRSPARTAQPLPSNWPRQV